jgi:hypothetical protein
MASGVSVVLPRSVRAEGLPDLAGASAGEGTPTLYFSDMIDWDDVEVSWQ